MRSQFKFLPVALLSFLVLSCGLTTDLIADTVKESMQEALDQDDFFKDYNLEVKDVKVIHVEGNKYKGFVAIDYMRRSYDVSIEVLSDGSMVSWEAPPGEFLFIVTNKLKDLWDELAE